MLTFSQLSTLVQGFALQKGVVGVLTLREGALLTSALSRGALLEVAGRSGPVLPGVLQGPWQGNKGGSLCGREGHPGLHRPASKEAMSFLTCLSRPPEGEASAGIPAALRGSADLLREFPESGANQTNHRANKQTDTADTIFSAKIWFYTLPLELLRVILIYI